VNVARSLFREVKDFDPDILMVIGGRHATILAGDFLSPFIDFTVIWEGVPA
jgi:hypothetical protein